MATFPRDHITALKGMIKISSLFTMTTTIFIGFLFTVHAPVTVSFSSPPCPSTNDPFYRDIMLFTLTSFGCFFSTTLLSLSLKQLMRFQNQTFQPILRQGMKLSVTGFVLGCSFLFYAFYNVLVGNVGRVERVPLRTLLTIIPLCFLVFGGLVVYVGVYVFVIKTTST